MIFTKEDAKKLATSGIYSVIDLALEVPSAYEDTRLNRALPQDEGVLCAFAKSCAISQFSKTLVVNLYLPEFDEYIDAVFFNYQPYIRSAFAVGKEFYIYGTLKHLPKLQVIHPKIITKHGELHSIYKPPFNRAPYPNIRKSYITLQNLLNDGLPQKVANMLYRLHFPDEIVLKNFYAKNLEDATYALKFAEIYNHLKELKKRKVEFAAKPLKTKKPEDFFKSLPFNPTNDQKKAVEDIAKDLSANKQMRRLLIGDVGSGKTLVILASAWLIAPQKTVLMAPTTVLANQLFEQANTLTNLKTVLITASSSASDSELQNAELIIGTHALLYKELPKAALIIVDEQHRFGVNQRAQITKLTGDGEFKPHYLQCSATPIPRTQALMDAQMVGVSIIKELPFEKNIDTKIISKDGFGSLLAHIDEQVKLGRQVAIIYPLVEESENFNYQSIEEGAPFWQNRYENVFVTHGKDKNKEEVLENFKNSGTVLISTTVIEVGISLPKLDTIVIVGAERLGLASLHQLRGRVGRYGNLGYCFLYTLSPKNERLIEFCKLKDGFEVAELDLKFRSSGDLVTGKRQSGAEFRFFSHADDYEIAKEATRLLS